LGSKTQLESTPKLRLKPLLVLSLQMQPRLELVIGPWLSTRPVLEERRPLRSQLLVRLMQQLQLQPVLGPCLGLGLRQA